MITGLTPDGHIVRLFVAVSSLIADDEHGSIDIHLFEDGSLTIDQSPVPTENAIDAWDTVRLSPRTVKLLQGFLQRPEVTELLADS